MSAYEIPDLRGFGLQLCGDGYQWNPYVHSRRIQCGTDPDKRVSLVLPSPPAFTSPAWDTVATPGMEFTWTAVPEAVYQLALAPGSGEPTKAQPRVEVVTTRTTAAWPDLQAVGIQFPGRWRRTPRSSARWDLTSRWMTWSARRAGATARRATAGGPNRRS